MSFAAKTTQDETSGALIRRPRKREAVPGLVLLCSVDQARCEVLRLRDGEIVIGRGEVDGVRLDDPQMSRRHARVRLDGTRWEVEDLGSRNGTWVDGEALSGTREGTGLAVLRAGGTLFLLRRDVEPCRAGIGTAGGTVIGPTLGRAWEQIGRAARSGTTLHVREVLAGAGRELRVVWLPATLVQAKALLAVGERESAREVLSAAREEILAMAGRIGDEGLRASFVGRGLFTARILKLAERES